MINWYNYCPVTATVTFLSFYNVIESDVVKVDDLRTVQNRTWSARWKWYHTGIGLDISVDTLEAINLTHHGNCDRCYTAMLTEWLRRVNPRPTWSALAGALRSPSVNMRNLAAQLPHQGEFAME